MSDEVIQEDELTVLKERAAKMGIKHHPSIGVDALREKVNAALADAPQSEAKAEDKGSDVKQPGRETLAERRMRLKREASELVRVRLSCMNPAKKEWAGEIITCGNTTVGTFKKFVPFNADDGWHIPRIMLQVLQDRQCQVFVTSKSKHGVAVRTGKLIKEFAIEVLTPLTKEELHDLAQRQAMAKSIDD